MENGFWDDLEQEGFDEEFESISEHIDQTSQANLILSEAVKRIEQAKLYETLLKHSLFGPNSARPEIISTVENEIKQFILSRLEILLGIKPNPEQQKKDNLFSEEEVDALKAIASKLISKDRAVSTTQPTINQVRSGPTPALNINQPVQQIQKPVINQMPEASYSSQKQPKRRKQKSENVSAVTNADYSQAVNPNAPPVKMPSQMQIDQLNAQLANMNSGSMPTGMSGGSDPMSRLIGMAAQQMMSINKDVKEE